MAHLSEVSSLELNDIRVHLSGLNRLGLYAAILIVLEPEMLSKSENQSIVDRFVPFFKVVVEEARQLGIIRHQDKVVLHVVFKSVDVFICVTQIPDLTWQSSRVHTL